MLHAKPGPGLRARVLPVLLLSLATAAFGGLVVLEPSGDDASVLAYASTPLRALELEKPAAVEREQARASRSRRLEQQEAARAAQAKAAAEAKAKAEAAARAKAKQRLSAPAAASRISGRCPVPNASFTDTWGAARSGGRAHKGTDMMAPYGSPVYAVASGVVRTASSSAGGISLYLDASNGESYFYAHNSRNLVHTGERVQAGDLIARVGTSGNAPDSAPHVHFEREVNGVSVNPYRFLRSIC